MSPSGVSRISAVNSVYCVLGGVSDQGTGNFMPLKTIKKAARVASMATVLAGLAGCGGFDGVQLDGKIFDAVGLNTGSVKSQEPKLAARQPLVVPPGLDSLPPPGSGRVEQPTLADIQDPDSKKKNTQAELEKQQADYCRVNYEDAKSRGDSTAASAVGPLGPCHGSLFSALKKWTTPSQETGDEGLQAQ